jgi:hypothetical protein
MLGPFVVGAFGWSWMWQFGQCSPGGSGLWVCAQQPHCTSPFASGTVEGRGMFGSPFGSFGSPSAGWLAG